MYQFLPQSVDAMRVSQLVVRESLGVEPPLVPRAQLSKATPHGSESAGLRRRGETLSGCCLAGHLSGLASASDPEGCSGHGHNTLSIVLIQTRLQAAPPAPRSPGARPFAPGQVWAQRSRRGSGRGRTYG